MLLHHVALLLFTPSCEMWLEWRGVITDWYITIQTQSKSTTQEGTLIVYHLTPKDILECQFLYSVWSNPCLLYWFTEIFFFFFIAIFNWILPDLHFDFNSEYEYCQKTMMYSVEMTTYGVVILNLGGYLSFFLFGVMTDKASPLMTFIRDVSVFTWCSTWAINIWTRLYFYQLHPVFTFTRDMTMKLRCGFRSPLLFFFFYSAKNDNHFPTIMNTIYIVCTTRRFSKLEQWLLSCCCCYCVFWRWNYWRDFISK